MKVAINRCWGGFGISPECLDLYNHLSGKKIEYDWDIERHDKFLIEAIERIGEKEASQSLGLVHIVEIPDGTKYEIDDYDGMESIHETHEVWS